MFANNNFKNFDYEFFPVVLLVPSNLSDLGFTRLRHHLQGEGRLHEARLIMRFEPSFLPTGPLAKEEAFKSLLQAYDMSNTMEPIWYVEGRTRIDLAKLLRSIG